MNVKEIDAEIKRRTKRAGALREEKLKIIRRAKARAKKRG